MKVAYIVTGYPTSFSQTNSTLLVEVGEVEGEMIGGRSIASDFQHSGHLSYLLRNTDRQLRSASS